MATSTSKSDKVVTYRPFKVGAQTMDDALYQEVKTLNAGLQRLDLYNVPSNAYLRHIWIKVSGVTAGNAAATAFNEDGPWNVIDTARLTDTNNADLVGPITGWELYIINKYGGYSFSDDPKASPVYSVTTGAGGTGGSFKFILRFPVELVPRDALGALTNKSASTPFRIVVTVASLTTVYSTAPTAAPAVTFTITPVNYWQPTASDGSGNPVSNQPPGVGTTQYWISTPYSVNSGALNEQLTSSTGYPVRNMVFVMRAGASRATGETDFPDPFRLQLQSNMLVDRDRDIWRHMIAQQYGYTAALSDATANAKDNGVYVLPFCDDFCHKPGWENRRSYLRTTDGMRMNMQGTIGGAGAHTLTVLTNYVGMAPGVSLAQVTT